MQGTIVLVNVPDGPVCLQITVGLRIGKAESLTEFIDECNNIFYSVANRIVGFHGDNVFSGCNLRIFNR